MALAVVRPIGSSFDEGPEPRGAGLQSAMIDEVFANATEDQALSFFVAVGARLAAAHPLPENDGLPRLEQAINEVWRSLGLGQVALTMEADGIAINHSGYMTDEAHRLPSWPGAAGALLRGAYGAWFQSIGGAATLHARLVRQTHERILLHYGL